MLKYNKKSLAKLEEKNPMWKGDKVGYSKLHEWIKSRIEKPKLCPKCKKRNTHDLANKGVYDRNLENWEWLCRKCHMDSDGRMKKFLSHQRKFPKGNKYYLIRKTLRGDESPARKISSKDVLEIRSMYALEGKTLYQIACIYGVCFQTISHIVNRKTWKHV